MEKQAIRHPEHGHAAIFIRGDGKIVTRLVVQIALRNKRHARLVQVRIKNAPLILGQLPLVAVGVPDDMSTAIFTHGNVRPAKHRCVGTIRFRIHAQRCVETRAIIG